MSDLIDAPASCSASLSFVGDELDPDELIGVVPIKAKGWNRKGETRRRTTASVLPLRPARTGTCFFPSRPYVTSSDINDHVTFLLSVVRQNLHAITQVVSKRHLQCEIVCFFDIDGPSVNPHPFLRPEVLACAEDMAIKIVPSLA